MYHESRSTDSLNACNVLCRFSLFHGTICVSSKSAYGYVDVQFIVRMIVCSSHATASFQRAFLVQNMLFCLTTSGFSLLVVGWCCATLRNG